MKPTSPFAAKTATKKQVDKKAQLAALREKALAARSPQTSTPTPTAPATSNADSIKPWKSKVKKLTRKARRLEEKLKQEKEEHTSTKHTLHRTREKLYFAQNQLTNHYMDVRNLENNLEDTEQRLQQLQTDYDRLQEKNDQLEKSLNQFRNNTSTYKGMIQPLQKKINALSRAEEMHQEEKETWDKKLEQHVQEIKRVEAINRKQSKQLSRWHSLAPEQLLQHLYESLSLKNHHEYYDTIALHRKFRWMQSTIRRKQPMQKQQLVPIFGTLTEREDGWWVQGTSGEHYKISNLPPVPVKEDTPVLASQNGSMVEVVTIYNDEIEQKRDSAILQRETEASPGASGSDDYVKKFPPHAYDWDILLVTSHNGSRFQQFLVEQGFKAEWIDPYEKSVTHVHQRMAAHDLVLLDLGHIPHVVTNTLPEDELWVQRFPAFRKKTLLARILFVAANCPDPREL